MSDVMLPSAASFDEMRAAGMAVKDPVAEQARARRYREEVIRLARLRATHVCGMTSRTTIDRERRVPTAWLPGDVLTPGLSRFSSYEVASECFDWGVWLMQAISFARPGPDAEPVPAPLAEVAKILDPPMTRAFFPECWPDAGHEPVPAPRKSKARRS